MRILMLVISSNTFPVYEKHREVWRLYMKRHPDIDCFFIEYKPTTFLTTLTQDTLYMRGVERYGNIIGKTIESLEYFLPKRPYDYIVRTNLSSVWDFSRLVQYLQDKPRTRFYSGQIGTHEIVPFASGAGMIMSQDVAIQLLQNRRSALQYNGFDDVAIGKALHDVGIYPVELPRVDFVSANHYIAHYDKVPEGTFHYRIKHEDYRGDRMEEPFIMKKIVESLYK